MHIDDDHKYHGAALIQIAEDPRFTAINSMMLGRRVCRNAYRINDSIAVYLKYASKPNKSHREYVFTFHKSHLAELKQIDEKANSTFLALVCVEARQICALTYGELTRLVARRKKAKGSVEDQYVLLVTAETRQQLRVYVNDPGTRNTMLGNPIVVPRNAFPSKVFS